MSQGSDLPNKEESTNSSDLLPSSHQSNNREPAPHINPLLPLSSHYALLNQTLLPAFAKSLARQSYSIAYAAGVQFVEMALVGIPSHAYFDAETSVSTKKNTERDSTNTSESASQCERDRQKSIHDAVRVATLLDEMVRTEKVGADVEETRRLRQMADEAASRDDINVCGMEASCGDWTSIVGDLGLEGSGDREDSPDSSTADQSIWDWVAVHADNTCGKLVDEICSGSGQASASASAATSEQEKSSREASQRDANDEQFQADMERALYLSGLDAAKVDSLRDVEDEARRRRRKHRRLKVSKRPKPEYVAPTKEGHNREEEDGSLKRHHRLTSNKGDDAVRSDFGGRDGPEVELPSAESVPEQTRSHHERKLDALNALAANCRDDFHALRTKNRIRVYPLNTYQGRVSGSVNGCTVIAPLIAIAHLRDEGDSANRVFDDDKKQSDVDIPVGMDWERASATSSLDLVDDDMIGVSDKIIEEIIDEGAPSILPSIRAKLNLSGSAFIIPSDVHDFLIDSALLTQDQFVGVSGGNIFDEVHLKSFISALLAEDASDCRIAATLFFHEHVVCLHRLVLRQGVRDTSEIWFDFIDALPAKKMLSCDKEDIGEYFLIENDTSLGESRDAREGLEISNGSNENGVRLRCSDAESLFAMIRCYAHSKLTDNDRSYISRCAWNESNTEFDPRVFQAFIWRGSKKI